MTTHTVPMIIDGKEQLTKDTFDVINPSNNLPCHRSIAATPNDARAAVDAAAKALVEWRKSTPATRRDILLRAAEIMNSDRQELAKYMIIETGSSNEWTQFNLNNAIDLLKDVAGRVSSIEGSAPALSNPNMKAMIVKEPYGVVFSVASWNSPYILGMRSTILPIAAGNTVVLKGSELSPRCFWAIASVLLRAGLPAGVLNYISTDRDRAYDVTEAIVSHREVKKLSFTGSIAVGRVVSEMAARHLKPVLLELGGQAAAIVWEDADLDLAVKECVAGAFMYAGQCCMSTDKVILHKTIRDGFMQKLFAAIKAGFPSDDEARLMIRPSGKDKVVRLLNEAEQKGAVIISPTLEGKSTTARDHDPTRLEPCVLSGVTPDMAIYQEENFGPTLSVFEVDTEQEALRLVNDSECGLSSAVFTKDLLRGIRLAEGIEAGAVHINNMSIHDESALPHGGCKATGFGRFNTQYGLSEWLRTKTITWKS
ncbi:aldehyde dehydrogenase domain-containing protein [Xylaria cf. heliscus]|nr:aldehyde dehydrogenase domain-containing protein [Xylaria cf. heliscus]